MINHEINKFKLITVTPPIIKNLKKNKIQTNKKFDAIIVGYIPYSRNINCNYGSYILTEIEIIKALKSIGKKNIVIKVKDGSKKMQSLQKRKLVFTKNI